jgi:AraC-like DNA-binding protein
VVSAVGYRTPQPDHPVHYGLPSPWLTVIFSLDDGVESASDRAALPSAPPLPIIAAGLHTRSSFVRPRPGQSGVQLAVHPLAARSLFGLPAAELSVTEYDGRQVLDRRATATQERLTECLGWSDAFALLGGHLARSLDRHPRAEVRSELRHAWSLLEASGGQRPIAEIAACVGLTPRHLGTLFRREVGQSPKTVAQLIRFQRSVELIKTSVSRTGRADLAGVAARSGYSDQSHLSRDFLERIGVPPTRWILEEFRNLQDHGAPPAA